VRSWNFKKDSLVNRTIFLDCIIEDGCSVQSDTRKISVCLLSLAENDKQIFCLVLMKAPKSIEAAYSRVGILATEVGMNGYQGYKLKLASMFLDVETSQIYLT
jgi:hypothetical protein